MWLWRPSASGTAREGAPPYVARRGVCAPEQLLGKPVGDYTDVYALGAVLYHLVTGHPVFSGATQDDVAQQHLYSAIAPLRTWRAGLPAGLENVVARSLSKEPDHRFRHASDLASAYRRTIARGGVGVPAVPPATSSVRTGIAPSGSTVAAASTPITLQPAVAVAAPARPPARTTPLAAADQPSPAAAAAAPPPTAVAALTPQPPQSPREKRPEPPFSRALRRVPGGRRRLWLAPVAGVVLVALLAASVVWVVAHYRGAAHAGARPTPTMHPITLTGCTSIAGLGDAAGMRFYDHQYGQGLTDSVSTCLKGLPMPMDGTQYYAWLIDTQREHATDLGPLVQKDGGWSLDYRQSGVNLLGLGNEVKITLEHGQPAAPGSDVAVVQAFPPDAFTHIKHLLLSYPDTPGQRGLLVGLQQQVQVLDAQAQQLLGFNQRQYWASIKCSAQNIVNILEGKKGPDYKPLAQLVQTPFDVDCASRNITAVDDNYGILGTNGDGYLPDAGTHAGLAMSAPDAIPHVKMHGQNVITAINNMQTWAQTVLQDALKVLQGSQDSATAAEIANLALDMDKGTDTNGDGMTDDVPGESGMFNAYTHAQLMAFLPFGPMGSGM